MNFFKTKDIAFIAIFIALALSLEYLEGFLPSLPQGGTINLGFIPLIILACYLRPSQYLFTAIIYSLIKWMLGLTSFYSLMQWIFDYPLPTLSVMIMPYFTKNKFKIIIGLIISMTIKLGFHYLSGIFFFADYTPVGMSPYLYSLNYNLTHIIPTLIVCILFVPIIFKTLKFNNK